MPNDEVNIPRLENILHYLTPTKVEKDRYGKAAPLVA